LDELAHEPQRRQECAIGSKGQKGILERKSSGRRIGKQPTGSQSLPGKHHTGYRKLKAFSI